MEEIKAPKKERKFLKAMGDVALTLFRELVLGIGKKVINKVGNKRQGLIIAFVVLASSFACAQYPTNGNKQRLGFQTTADGLVYRGRAADTVGIKSNGLNNAYFILDTINNVLYNYIKTKGGWQFNNSDTIIIIGVTMPFDSITFNTAKDGTVITGEVEYNDTQGSLIQGLKGGLVTNVIGQQLHQRVNNRTGSTLEKGDVVYLSGSQGNRITVVKAIATSDPTSANTFGIVAESIANNASGYVITEGLITNINTSALVEDSAVYLSPTVAGGFTSTKPQAPNHGVYLGVCVKSNAGSGELFVKIRNGQELDELHDVRISSPVNNASLYYKSSESIWRDTTAALLVSDTASMLTNYLRSGIAASTYLPLSGGTLTGGLNIKAGNGNQLSLNNNGERFTQLNFGNNSVSKAIIWWDDNNKELVLLANNLGTGHLIIDSLGATSLSSTLGVTGATTLSNLSSASTTIVTASTTGLLSGIATLPIANGGTGGTTAAAARTALGATVRGANTFLLTDLGAISFLRYNVDNTVSQRGADGMRTDLGGTTIGQSMFTLTNPSAITFPRFNADNTVTALDAASFRTAIGAGTGSGNGTVTSVTGSSPISSSGGTTPNITISNAAGGTSGVVSATTQSFSGTKTFLSDMNVTGFSTLTGGASIGNLATTSSLTKVVGMNTSNTFGELTLAGGLSVSSGVLSIQAATASQTGTVISFGSQTFGGNKTFNGTVTLASATGTATSVIGRSSTGQVVDVPLSGLSLTSGTLTTSNNDINTYLAINGPGIVLSSSFGTATFWYVNINQNSTVTITLPSASGNIYKTLVIKNSGTGAVNSNAPNVEPLNSTTLGTSILVSGGGKYATLVSNGTNWIKMSGN